MTQNEWPTLAKKQNQKPQAIDAISLGMIESDLVLWLVFLLLVSTSSKIKEKHIQIPARTVKQKEKQIKTEKNCLNHFIYTVGLASWYMDAWLVTVFNSSMHIKYRLV